MIAATALAPAASANSKTRRPTGSRSVVADVDMVRSYLRDIGRVPLLSHQ
ncbi:sigma-70 factor domain-containing protein, partial [Synechococcus sp. UW140]